MKTTINILFGSLILLSCRPSELLQSGRTQENYTGEIKQMMVIAYPKMLGDHEIFEKEGARVFSKKGLSVNSLHQSAGQEDSVLKTQPEQLRTFLINHQIDAVVEIRLVSIRKEESSSESQYPTRREYRIMDDTHYDKLIQEYGKREDKGAIFEDTKVKMDVKLLARVGDKYVAIWSSRIECSNPKNNRGLARASVKKAKKALSKEELLP